MFLQVYIRDRLFAVSSTASAITNATTVTSEKTARNSAPSRALTGNVTSRRARAASARKTIQDTCVRMEVSVYLKKQDTSTIIIDFF